MFKYATKLTPLCYFNKFIGDSYVIFVFNKPLNIKKVYFL